MEKPQPILPRLAMLVILCIVGVGMPISCGRAPTTRPQNAPETLDIQLPKVDEQIGTAVVMIIDTSGSMAMAAGNDAGDPTPKYEVAQRAMQQVVESTDEFLQTHPERLLKMGLVVFAGGVETALPVEKFDKQKVSAAIDQIREPAGGTAIGTAIKEGFVQLYGAGCYRKYLICVTDGANTVGPDPAAVSKYLFDKTEGEVEMHFVAFDTSASSFAFLSSVNGQVVEAANEQQLRTQIQEIYDRRIFAEAPAETELESLDDENLKNN